MSKRMLIAVAVIVLVVIVGMVMSVKRSLTAAASRDPTAEQPQRAARPAKP
jgi:hypothetical protein